MFFFTRQNHSPEITSRAITYLVTLVMGAPAFVPSHARAFEPDLDDSFELRATRAFSTSFSTGAEATYVDARVKTRGTESEELDQRYVAALRFDSSYSPSQAVSLRVFARGRYFDGLRQDSLSADRKVSEKRISANGALDASFAASQGIEVFVGCALLQLPESKKDVRLVSVSSQSTYKKATVYAPRLGLLKRAPSFSAGMFYTLMAETKRTYTRSTNLESETGEEFVTLPSSFGGTLRFTPGGGKDLELELSLALVQLGDSSEKTEQGTDLSRDYYRIHLGGYFPVVSGTLSAYATVSHRTLAYNDQGFMTMENIPLTTIQLLAVTAAAGPRFYGGVQVGYGSDSQSIPELNAQFTYKSYALKLGLEVPM